MKKGPRFIQQGREMKGGRIQGLITRNKKGNPKRLKGKGDEESPQKARGRRNGSKLINHLLSKLSESRRWEAWRVGGGGRTSFFK